MRALLLALTLFIPPQVPPATHPEIDRSAPLVPLWERTHGLPPMHWSADLDSAAPQESEDRQVPILVWVLRDKDPASEAWIAQKIFDKKFIQVIEQETVPAIIVLPAKDGSRHPEEQVRANEKADPHTRCPRLRSCRCDTHTGIEPILKDLAPPELLPAAYFFSPEDKTLEQIPAEIPFQENEKLEEYLQSRGNPERATRIHLRFMETHLKRAEKYYTEAEYTKGSRELVVAKRILHRFGPRVRLRWDEVCRPYLGYGKQMLLRAKQIGRIDPTRRIKLLRRITEELSGLPPCDTAVALLKRDLRLNKKKDE